MQFHPLHLPSPCFDLHPGRRLDATREYVASLSEKDRKRLHGKLKKELSFPHYAYSIPAWGLMVLPGPGGEIDDPSEEHCDWTPGLGTAARHFAEFPSYVAKHVSPGYLTNRGMWQRMRDVISNTSFKMPKVRSEDRFACWGLINLTKDHARSETIRQQQTTPWDLKTLWGVIEICRPALIIAPPSKMGGGRCHLRVQQLLSEKGAVRSGTMRGYPSLSASQRR